MKAAHSYLRITFSCHYVFSVIFYVQSHDLHMSNYMLTLPDIRVPIENRTKNKKIRQTKKLNKVRKSVTPPKQSHCQNTHPYIVLKMIVHRKMKIHSLSTHPCADERMFPKTLPESQLKTALQPNCYN